MSSLPPGQSGQTYNDSVNLRRATQSSLEEQVARELIGRTVQSQEQYVPRQPQPQQQNDEDMDVETRLVTIHATELTHDGEVKKYRSPKSSTFNGFKRSTEIYYRHLTEDRFCERRACEKGYEMLLQNNIVIITGGCGDGKTTLGCYLLKKVSEEYDIEAVRINSPKDWMRVLEFDYQHGEKIAVMLDDCFGSIGMADYMFEEWHHNVQYMSSFLESKKVYLIMTSKKHLYSQGAGRVTYNQVFLKKYILDLTTDEYKLTWCEKKEVLRKHLEYYNLDEDIATNLPEDCPDMGFCLLVHQFCIVEDFQNWGLRFFTNPIIWYSCDLESISATEKEIWGVMVLLLLGDGIMRPMDYNPFGDEKTIYKQAKEHLKYTSLQDGFPPSRLVHLCEHIDTVYVKWDKKEKGYRFIDHYMEEAAMMCFGKWHVREVLKRSSLSFLREYMVTNRYEAERPEKDILIELSPSYFPYLTERLLKELVDGNIEQIVSHRVFLDDSYIEFFVKHLKEKDELVKVLQAKDKKCQRGIVYLCTMYGQERLIREIVKSEVFSKLADKQWAKDEKQAAVQLATEFKVSSLQNLLNQL
ncbi:uncharacterized protein LOC124143330 [Haliotis rufescens]|uniref:uncharacterized protein LOC124143330 n=1 Tax=Haliotis rufescens TaxID=6454 RepID=UPI00201EDC26|nr:uncharacterized protein LOC124143330 [Haliotis rufescens]